MKYGAMYYSGKLANISQHSTARYSKTSVSTPAGCPGTRGTEKLTLKLK